MAATLYDGRASVDIEEEAFDLGEAEEVRGKLLWDEEPAVAKAPSTAAADDDEDSESVKVFLRVRPFTKAEARTENKEIKKLGPNFLSIESDTKIEVNPPSTSAGGKTSTSATTQKVGPPRSLKKSLATET